MEVSRMKNKVHVVSAIIENNTLSLHVEDHISLKDVDPKEQMLVDSENFAFIYILEMNQEYTYLVLNEGIWPTIKKGVQDSLPVFLINRSETLLLPMFNEELNYLIDNIKDNSNYGEEMVKKVESTF
jgi:hypothetical protein